MFRAVSRNLSAAGALRRRVRTTAVLQQFHGNTSMSSASSALLHTFGVSSTTSSRRFAASSTNRGPSQQTQPSSVDANGQPPVAAPQPQDEKTAPTANPADETVAPEEEDVVVEEPAVDEEEADRQALKRWALYAVGGLGTLAWCKWCNDYANALYGRKDDGSVRTHVQARGRPSLGGPFTLVRTNGEPLCQTELLGNWTFFYFGFVHCPEICPVELNRMTKVVDAVKAVNGKDILPMFVSCDPKRDSLDAIQEYLSVFHKNFVGLVGTPNQVNDVCKSYRIYYSLPDKEAAQTSDYLIDHSIAIFLFDPKGRFVDFFGNRFSEDEMTEKVLEHMVAYDNDPEWTNY